MGQVRMMMQTLRWLPDEKIGDFWVKADEDDETEATRPTSIR